MPGVDFDGLLKEAMGLDTTSLGPSAIARAVQSRLAACNIADIHGYWLRVRSSPTELQELIEAVVVPETWFFRDRAAFDALATMVRREVIENPARPELRLLSLPCSSGEEPFSMAIALLDAGVPANRFSVDGVDISARALDLASRACYGSNSFRGQELEFRARHFRAAHGKWQLSDGVRERVRFQQGNLFAPSFLPGQGSYDYIFCRNVLIYFDQEMQARALEVLLRLLAPGGCLFVGPSETGLLPRQRLVSAQLPMAFAFRRAEAAAPIAAPAKGKASVVPAQRPERRAATRAAPGPTAAERRVSAESRAAQVAAQTSAQAISLDQARRLADQGRLQDAQAVGEEHLRQHGASAAAYSLLGLVRDAAGDRAAAIGLFRKALYLDPGHRESLSHLVLLLDQQGKPDAARVLRERLRRVEAQESG